MSRFVILEHDWPTPHFDLMLEVDGVLRTWRLSELPEPGQTVPAEPIGDHRLMYLEYQGPVSGGRGSVRRVAAGEYDPATMEIETPGGRWSVRRAEEGWVCG